MKKKVRRKAVTTMILFVIVVLALLWLFTPFGFFVVKPQGEYQITVTIGDTEFMATMENNTSSRAFHRMLERGPKTVHMRDYGGMEKVGMLWKGLPANNEQITTQPGDIVLFMGSSIVVYYRPNSWNFTKMGHIENVSQEELSELLGDGNVSITFALEQ